MAASVQPVQMEQVACEVCLKEVPTSEAVVSEASDYVAYFCGLDCYRQWKAQSEETAGQGSPPSPGA